MAVDKFVTMNKRIIGAFILALVGSLIRCNAPSSDSSKEKEEPASVVNDLPNMTITLLDGSALNIKGLKGKTVLIFFQPDCDHCQREAAEIRKNLEAFRNSTLYFITSHPRSEIEKFGNNFGLMGHSNVFFAWTSTENVLNSFGPISAPSIYLYSSDHKLIKAFNGEVKIELVLNYI